MHISYLNIYIYSMHAQMWCICRDTPTWWSLTCCRNSNTWSSGEVIWNQGTHSPVKHRKAVNMESGKVRKYGSKPLPTSVQFGHESWDWFSITFLFHPKFCNKKTKSQRVSEVCPKTEQWDGNDSETIKAQHTFLTSHQGRLSVGCFQWSW